MGCKGQHTVEQHAEAHCFSGDLDIDAPKRDGQEPKLRQLVLSDTQAMSYVNEFRVLVQGWANYGPRAACGPPEYIMQPVGTYM